MKTLTVFVIFGNENEQLDQRCQQLVAMLCCTLSTMLCCTLSTMLCCTLLTMLCCTLSTMLCCTLSTTVVNNHCSQLFMVNNHCSIIVDNHQQACFINYCRLLFNNIVIIIILSQHRTTIDRTILINIVNSTSVVEP